MGKKLDRLLGRTFKTAKFTSLLDLAVIKIAVLKDQSQVRYLQSRNDVAELLKLGQEERALLRVEHVIREQNMLDVFSIIEVYCMLLSERSFLIESQKDCPSELKEAISSLIFASSRCGDLPELQHIHTLFSPRYGKEFVAAATELRNDCGVNPKLVQKLSSLQPSLEHKIKLLTQIAAETGTTFHMEYPSPDVKAVEGSSFDQHNTLSRTRVSPDANCSVKAAEGASCNQNISGLEEQIYGSIKQRRYNDVTSAAEAAFKSAAYAAAAARAAVELSKSETHDKGSDDNSPSPRRKRVNQRAEEDRSLKRS